MLLSPSPNLNPIQLNHFSFYFFTLVFPSLSLPRSLLLPAVSLFLPELIGENTFSSDAWETDDGGWDLFSTIGQAIRKESCWDGKLNVLKNES